MSSVAKSTKVYSGFSPVSIPGCSLWLDAADRNTLNLSGSNLTTWNDKSGNAYTGTAVASPTVVQNAINGLPVIQFNGTSQYINFGNVINMGTSQIYFFAVCKFDSTADGTIIAKSSATGLAGRWFLLRDSANGIQAGIDATGSSIGAVFASTSTNAQLLMGGWNRSIVSIFQNGTQQNTNTLANTSSLSSTNPLWVGAYPNSTASAPQSGLFLNGKVAEVLVYLSDLTSSQRQQVEGYLAHKWGLVGTFPATQPYKSIKPVTRAFQPIDVSGCELWLDAADRNTLTLSGSNVTTWTDKSSNQYAFSQGTTARQPTYITGAVSGLNVVRFTGSSQQYLFDGNSLPVGTNSVSMFGVIKTNSSNGNICVWAKTTLSAVSSKWSWFRDGTTMIMGFEGTSSGAWATAFTETVPANTYRMMSMVNNRPGGSNTLFQNGTLMNTKTFTPDTTTNLTSSFFMLVGAYNDAAGSSTPGGYYMDGDICEVVIYVKNLSSSERQQIEGYLANKWGTKPSLPISHPYGPTISAVSSPLSISGCSLWLDAADSNSMTLSGANVTQWNDKSGNLRHATAQVAATYNSSPAYLNFTGTNYYSFPNFSFAVNNYFSFFIIERLQSATTLRHMLGTDSTGDNSAPAIRYSGTQNGTTNASGFRFGFFNNDLDAQNIPAFSTAAEQPTRIWSIVFNTSFRGIYLNGVLMASDTNNTKLLAWPTPLLGRGYSSYYYYGFISEILGYGGEISTLQRQQVESYLANKWGISISLNQGGSKMYRPVTVAFNPLQISTCALWLDANDPTTLTLSGSNVTTWRDKSGNGYNLTATNNPIYSTTINGLKTITTNGSTNYLQNTALVLAQPFSFFCVVRNRAASSAGFQLVLQGNVNTTAVILYSSQTTPASVLTQWAGGPNSYTSPTIAISSNVTQLYSAIFNGSSSSLGMNGVITSGLTPGTNSLSAFRIGIDWTATVYQAADHCEYLLFNRVITATERQQVEGYLAEKWGLQANLPTTHPYKKITP